MYSEYWEDRKSWLNEKKQNNLNQSIQIIENKNIEYKKLSDTHYRVKNYDFYPTTGLYINITTKKRGRGVFNLIKLIS